MVVLVTSKQQADRLAYSQLVWFCTVSGMLAAMCGLHTCLRGLLPGATKRPTVVPTGWWQLGVSLWQWYPYSSASGTPDSPLPF